MKTILNKLNSLIGKAYDAETYHCYSLLEEVGVAPLLKDVHVDTALNDIIKYKGLFTEIKEPEDFCIVLLGKFFGYAHL